MSVEKKYRILSDDDVLQEGDQFRKTLPEEGEEEYWGEFTKNNLHYVNLAFGMTVKERRSCISVNCIYRREITKKNIG